MQAAPMGYPQGYGYVPGYGPQPMVDDYSYDQFAEDEGAFFPGESEGEFGVSAAVGEAEMGVTQEQYALVGGTNITVWLMDPWPAVVADQAYALVKRAATGDKDAIKVLDELKKQSDKGDPKAMTAWTKFGSVSKMKMQGQPRPSTAARVRAARSTVVARPIKTATEQARKLAERARKMSEQMRLSKLMQIQRVKRQSLMSQTQNRFQAEKQLYEDNARELEAQLQRRDWSDETRAQLEAQKAELEAVIAEMNAAAAAQAAQVVAAPAALIVPPAAEVLDLQAPGERDLDNEGEMTPALEQPEPEEFNAERDTTGE